MPLFNMPDWFERWNKKIHIYLGLYFLLFLWLFALSGLILNHPHWRFAQFWPSRVVTSSEHPIQALNAQGDLARAGALAEQLGLSGEIELLGADPNEDRLDVRVARPGRTITMKADFGAGRAKAEKIETNLWGVVTALHQFNGVRMDDPAQMRDWFATTLWTLSMDALCLGLIVLVLSSFYMWYRLDTKRRPGLIVLGAGILCCGFFVFGLGWLG